MIDLQRDGDVYVLRFDAGENRFSPDFLGAVEGALDSVAKNDGPGALVTVGTGKFYSNGLDLDWLGANQDRFGEYLGRVHGLYARLLELPMPTVAALNGHAFAGGGMLALAHDFAVMRTDRGYFCLPEVDLGMSFTPGMNALIAGRLPKATAHEAMLTGRRYAAEQAREAGIVQRTAAEGDVLPAAVEQAAAMAGRNGAAVAKIRTDLYRPVLDALHGPALP
ncbi:enoyl-CoA hydratase/isomerase family protein [Actinomadura darangshiensis]|uniref:Enoyl-CoA hydratase/isomerase family protein n=1 Tax=Actinomadura darangshiensis TaxID=705336 RepID=A0A4R5A020_9ACTN|nr:enoyl-CoA hydratase-related protein [Actinomadura darangshiensis]TDD63944.1 enoyl-CoA hydratase/isomerase family protein [Actinomadura darangshiensis]